ncbi:hypothetical protein ACJVC5_18720 [Peredibacter sp. HCB2-198]|uniref:hypothetical protein n=1 Tax=Peredibacter sp. HCB2-198 TaxID=3383025 RepID=UPI0038B5FE17
MRFCLVLMLIFSTPVFAQKTLGPETFQAHVRPVLNGILGDFYQMITLFPDFPKEIVPLIQEMDTLTSDKEHMLADCPRVLSKKCATSIKSIRQKLQTIRGLSLKLQDQMKMSHSIHLSSVSGLRLVNQFDLELENIKGYLDNASFLETAAIPQKRETYYVIKQLDELNTYLSLALVEFIPFTYKVDFRHFYTNFVQPIQLQISKGKNYEFLNRNVNSLNFAINLLNMNLTKRNKKTPDGMGPYLAVIHNRWNSLLRYYF